jgi:ankyrin repeat protein
MPEATLDLIPQRWERPWIYDVPPGFWKQQLSTKYRAIAVKGDLDGLRQLLTEHPEFLNKRGSHNRTLLWEAVRRGRLPAVQWLVEQGADIDATACYNGESMIQLTPYCAAVYYRRTAIADYLLARGTQIDIFRAAFMGDQTRVADELAVHPDLINAEDPHDSLYYMPLLAFAVVGGHAALVDFLLERGASAVQYSALLIYLAARDSRIDMIDLLVAHGAEVRAVEAGIFQMVSDLPTLHYLLDHGASATRVAKNGFPPLTYLVRGDKGEHPDKVRILLEHGADVNALGPKGRTALHYAAAAGFVQVITLLLDHGAALALKDEQGETALSLARVAGKTAAVELLMQRGAVS